MHSLSNWIITIYFNSRLTTYAGLENYFLKLLVVYYSKFQGSCKAAILFDQKYDFRPENTCPSFVKNC